MRWSRHVLRLTPASHFIRLPWAEPAAILAQGALVVLAPHPDDESLGCGGLIAACRAAGRAVHVVMLTDGAASHPNVTGWPAPRVAALRADEVKAAVAALGVGSDCLHFLDAQDGAAPASGAAFDVLAERLAAILRASAAGTLITTWQHDPHPDHRAAALLADAASRLHPVRRLAMPIWGWRRPNLPEPIRGWRVRIAGHKSAKRRAIAAHASQFTDLIEARSRRSGLNADFMAIFDRDYEVILRPSPGLQVLAPQRG